MIVGISMVKDEADIIESTIDNLIEQGVERFLVLDNGSTDGTRELLEQYPQVSIADDPEIGYYQSKKMTALAEDARCLGARWVIPFDADEIWRSRRGTVAELLTEQTDAQVVWAQTYEHPPIHPPLSPFRALQPKPHRKVAFRATAGAVVAQGNHDVSLTGKRTNGLEIREFQYRTFEQFVRKVRNGKAAYDATNLPEGEGAHWRTFGAMTDDQLAVQWKEMTSRTDVMWDPC